MAKFDHERAHMAANLVSDPPVPTLALSRALALAVAPAVARKHMVR